MRFYHKPLALEIRQPLPTLTTPNKVTLLTYWVVFTNNNGAFCAKGFVGGMPTENFAEFGTFSLIALE